MLHELGHALLGHTSYKRDIELIVMEREAWEQARSIGNRFGHPVTDEIIEDALDTYRDWLHRRSLCPNCAMTGIQTDNYTYHCPTCTQSWRVNEARTCQLKRYRTKNDPIK